MAGSGHPADVGDGFDMVVAGSLDPEHHMARVHHRRPGAERHRVAVDPGTGVVAAERRDHVGSSLLGRVLVDLAERRQGQNHLVAAAAAVEVGRGPGVGRQGVERNRSSRFQTLSKVYLGNIVLFDRGWGTRDGRKFSLEERALSDDRVGQHGKCGVIVRTNKWLGRKKENLDGVIGILC